MERHLVKQNECEHLGNVYIILSLDLILKAWFLGQKLASSYIWIIIFKGLNLNMIGGNSWLQI